VELFEEEVPPVAFPPLAVLVDFEDPPVAVELELPPVAEEFELLLALLLALLFELLLAVLVEVDPLPVGGASHSNVRPLSTTT
jgi:hypothetical protein